ncbi:hypothetical protein LTR28_001121, partial [Elasticomyces elasticus]
MSASPPAASLPSAKRPLEDPSSPSGPTDQPDAKRPALDKVIKDDEVDAKSTTPQTVTATEQTPATSHNGATDGQGDTVVPDAPSTHGLSAAQ